MRLCGNLGPQILNFDVSPYTSPIKCNRYLEELGLVPSKGAANAQIQLLPRVHREGLVLIGYPELAEGSLDVSVSDGTEVGAVDVLQRGKPYHVVRVPTQIVFSNSLSFPCLTGNFPCANLHNL